MYGVVVTVLERQASSVTTGWRDWANVQNNAEITIAVLP